MKSYIVSPFIYQKSLKISKIFFYANNTWENPRCVWHLLESVFVFIYPYSTCVLGKCHDPYFKDGKRRQREI